MSGITDFQTLLKSTDKPIFVDWGAEWCAPCRAFAPAFHKASKEFAAKAVFVTVDIDTSPDIASEYGVKSIPILKVFHKGEMVDELTPAREDGLRKLLVKHCST